jgi:hypothetical protein
MDLGRHFPWLSAATLIAAGLAFSRTTAHLASTRARK